MLRLGTVVLGAEEVERTATFWAAVFDYETVRFPDSENDFTILVPRDRVGTRIAVQRAETPAQNHPRVHLDLVVDSAVEQQRETDRLVGLGATVVDWDSYPDAADFVVLADPDGNRFCIVDASHG
jgi:catechol 2,3-dioxygenase-like lactoylglutathione lyase family enzyme